MLRTDEKALPTEGRRPTLEVKTPVLTNEADIRPKPEAGESSTGSHITPREKSLPASNGSKLPPHAGSYEEAVSTWSLIAFPGALSLTNNDVERELRLLLWQEK